MHGVLPIEHWEAGCVEHGLELIEDGLSPETVTVGSDEAVAQGRDVRRCARKFGFPITGGFGLARSSHFVCEVDRWRAWGTGAWPASGCWACVRYFLKFGIVRWVGSDAGVGSNGDFGRWKPLVQFPPSRVELATRAAVSGSAQGVPDSGEIQGEGCESAFAGYGIYVRSIFGDGHWGGRWLPFAWRDRLASLAERRYRCIPAFFLARHSANQSSI